MLRQGQKELFDTNSSLYVLSSLMRNPLLLQDEHYAFCKTDFYKPLQQMVFFAVFNMAQTGVEHITPQDIDTYLSQYDTQYGYYKSNKGYEFVVQCYNTTEGSDIKQFDIYYNRLKKFSILRDLESVGIDTTEFYDTNKDALNLDLEDEKLNNVNIKSIPERIRYKLVQIENKHIGKDNNTSQIASENMRTLVNSLMVTPEVGLPLDGKIMNFAARGARKGKLYTYSAPSGAGKTRYMLGNAAAISMPYIDTRTNKIISREEQFVIPEVDYEPAYQKILFVTTEQQADEIQTMLLAYVSGVNEKSILLGNYTEQERKRVEMALDIIDVYGDNFIIECIPDPSIALVKARLAKFIVEDKVQYIFYDYIFSSPGLLSEFRDVAVREDVALMMLSNSLKETAANYDIFIQSATQLNDGWSKKEVGARDQNCIRGSKAIADKIDLGAIGVRISEEEKKMIAELVKKLYKEGKITHEPNIVIDIYKNRRGELNSVKVFRYFDYGTCHCEDLFVTTTSYEPIDNIGELKFNVYALDYKDLGMAVAA